jgi:hypothetical protein
MNETKICIESSMIYTCAHTLQMSSGKGMKFNIDSRRVERQWISFFEPQACRLNVLAAATINDQSRDIVHFNRHFAQFWLDFYFVNEITKLKFATVGNTATSYWKDLGSKLNPDTANIDLVHGFIQSFQTNSMVASLNLSLAQPS